MLYCTNIVPLNIKNKLFIPTYLQSYNTRKRCAECNERNNNRNNNNNNNNNNNSNNILETGVINRGQRPPRGPDV